MLQFDVNYTLTKEEVEDGFRRMDLRRASKTRLIVQTVILCLVAAWAIGAFFISGMKEFQSLMIGIVGLVLIPVMWFVPEWKMKRDLEQALEDIEPTHLWVFDDGIDFGDQKPEESYYHYRTFYMIEPEKDAPVQSLILKFKSDAVVIVPRRVFSEEQWEYLVTKCRL